MTILVDPLGEKDLKITGLNRKIEKRIVDRYEKRGIFERGKYYG
jgi:predicted HAD superfamily phosphohydrolase YqeG